MKKIRNITSALEILSGLSVVSYAFYLMKDGTVEMYLSQAMALGIILIVLGLVTFFSERTSLKVVKIITGAVFYALFISVILFFGYVMTGMFANPPEKLDYIVVPGAAVNGEKPSEALKKRIDRAYEYMDRNPGTVCIATGAVEEDGEISEAECIARGLIERGISDRRLVREELSTTTVENMKNSSAFIERADMGVGVVTNGFHVARSVMILKNFTDYPVYGCSANAFSRYTPYYMTREYIVFVIDVAKGNYSIRF